jgi:hypothetical protein
MTSSVRRLAVVVLAAAVVAVAGCGGDTHARPDLAEAEVIVTCGGQPLPNAQVTLTPTDTKYGGSAIATGVTDEGGRAKLSCGGKPGACVGVNKVTVTEAPGSEESRSDDPDVSQKREAEARKALKNRPIPPKYATLASSDLTLDVKKDQKEYKIDLKR